MTRAHPSPPRRKRLGFCSTSGLSQAPLVTYAIVFSARSALLVTSATFVTQSTIPATETGSSRGWTGRPSSLKATGLWNPVIVGTRSGLTLSKKLSSDGVVAANPSLLSCPFRSGAECADSYNFVTQAEHEEGLGYRGTEVDDPAGLLGYRRLFLQRFI
jgi:hypothetical protein